MTICERADERRMDKKVVSAGRAAFILVNVIAICAGIFFFFGPDDFSLNQKENSYLIGASYMTMNNEFYKIIGEEIAHRVEAEGDRLILRDPALNAGRQAMQVQEMLDMGIDVLIITPVGCLKEGQGAGNAYCGAGYQCSGQRAGGLYDYFRQLPGRSSGGRIFSHPAGQRKSYRHDP